MISFRTLLLLNLLIIAPLAATAEKITPVQDSSIALIGGGQGERLLHDPTFETEIQQRFAGKNLVIRNLCDDGDTPGFRAHSGRNSPFAFPGAEKFFPLTKSKDNWGTSQIGKGFSESPDQWLKRVKADTIIAWFGFSESFAGAGGLAAFRAELEAWLDHTAAQKYNGASAPRVVLLSPLAVEDRSADLGTPNGKAVNVNLELYGRAIAEIAQKRGLLFVDLYTTSQRWYQDEREPLTVDGMRLNMRGHQMLGRFLADAVFTAGKPSGDPAKIAAAIREKNRYWEQLFKVPNGVHVFGVRHKPFGPDNYPDEMKKLDELVAIRDQAVWATAKGGTFDVAAADAKTHPLPVVKTNYNPKNRKNGSETYLPATESLKTLTVPDGYRIELFASETEFPELANPVQMSFDNRGRLWVATMPSYPHWQPGDPQPNDKLLILEDTNNDGKADKRTVFAAGLHLPLGFEFAPEGVYVSQSSHLVLLSDTNGDDQADVREIIFSGFDDHDTHHAISAFCADPSGAIYLAEGTFLHSHVETLYGTVRTAGGGFFRFAPQRRHLERTLRVSIPNPWGTAIDSYGQDFFADTSGPAIRWMSPSSMAVPYGEFAPLPVDLTPKPQAVRPTAGLEFVSSRHFPDEVQGDLLINNNIGFLGTKQHAVSESGTGYQLTFRQNLLQSTDGNFRPVDMEFAPDGSLYVIDWHNVLIGHMQHSARDPLRDHSHGRVYRITYPGRPLVKAPTIAGADIDALFDLLKLPEDRARYRTRRELRGRPVNDVLAGLQRYLKRLDAKDAAVERHQLEGLWVSWGIDRVDVPLLKRLLTAKDHRVRAAAVRVLRYNGHRVSDQAELLLQAANDTHGRVRMEAVNAGSWLGKETGLKILAAARNHGEDSWLKPVYGAVKAYLEGGIIDPPPDPIAKTTLTGEAKRLFELGAEVYGREGHCATCHQPDGNGLPAAQFPPIAKSRWVTGSSERLIRLTLHGLLGPIEVNGVQYQGAVPMTAFKNLSDEEIAGVLTYVRNSFGNKADPILPDQVKSVRAATKDQNGFINPADLLKQFPHDP